MDASLATRKGLRGPGHHLGSIQRRTVPGEDHADPRVVLLTGPDEAGDSRLHLTAGPRAARLRQKGLAPGDPACGRARSQDQNAGYARRRLALTCPGRGFDSRRFQLPPGKQEVWIPPTNRTV